MTNVFSLSDNCHFLRAGECQLYLDVDCSSITYETKPSTVVLEAVNKTLDSLEGKNTTEINLSDPTKPENQTISASPNATLANSLLSSIDKDKASKEDIKEAFCRDIDTFSWEFVEPELHKSVILHVSPGSVLYQQPVH